MLDDSLRETKEVYLMLSGVQGVTACVVKRNQNQKQTKKPLLNFHPTLLMRTINLCLCHLGLFGLQVAEILSGNDLSK